jgi:hypothetical protein
MSTTATATPLRAPSRPGAHAEQAWHAAQLGPGLQPVPGFENTGYAWRAGEIVWVGRSEGGADSERQAGEAHPRNLRQPWHAPATAFDAAWLREGALGALRALARLRVGIVAQPPGLLRWLAGHTLPFPMSAALPRFEALRHALAQDDPAAFAAAAPRVLGLGPGLTPSGDDFLGGIFFALAHAPRRRWKAALPKLHADLLRRCSEATNPISTALLNDGMQGRSYRALHELLAALQSRRSSSIGIALRAAGHIGASSGGDLAAGVLVALATTPLPADSPPAKAAPAAANAHLTSPLR